MTTSTAQIAMPSERRASRIARSAHRWTHASSDERTDCLPSLGKSATCPASTAETWLAGKRSDCSAVRLPKPRRRDGCLICRSDGTQDLARDRHRPESGPGRPPAPGRAVPASAAVRGQGDGWACPRLSAVDPDRACRLVHLVPPVSVPDRDRHPRRAAVLHRHGRQRVGPLRHDLVVGRREPPRQLGDPHRRRVARPVLPSPWAPEPIRARGRLRGGDGDRLGVGGVRDLHPRLARAGDRLHRYARRPAARHRWEPSSVPASSRSCYRHATCIRGGNGRAAADPRAAQSHPRGNR